MPLPLDLSPICVHLPLAADRQTSPEGSLSTPAIVARLQDDLDSLISRSRSAAPALTASLVDAQQLVAEMVSRWRRSTTLALDSIKTFEDQLARKNADIERLQKQVSQLVSAGLRLLDVVCSAA